MEGYFIILAIAVHYVRKSEKVRKEVNYINVWEKFT